MVLRRFHCALLGLVVVLIGCAGQPSPGAASLIERPECSGAWTAQYNVDSSVALCAPPGFALVWNSSDHAAWARHDPRSSHIAMVSIDLYAPGADTLDGTWPRRLAARPECGTACWTVDTVVRMRDTVRGRLAQIELGQVSGGKGHLVRQPMLIASWEPKPGWRVDARGSGPSMGVLDTLWQVLRTATVATPAR